MLTVTLWWVTIPSHSTRGTTVTHLREASTLCFRVAA